MLKDCFKKFGKALSEKDKAAITQMVADGMGEQEAVDSYIETLKAQIEVLDKNLLVTHNLSEENLKHVLELGGMAAPSLAIQAADKGFNSFGEITLIGDPSMIEDKSIKFFDSDVYSPRQSRARYKIDLKKFNALMEEMRDVKGLERPDLTRLENSGVDSITRSNGAMYHYLVQNNNAPKITKKKVPAKLKESMKLVQDKFQGDIKYYALARDEDFIALQKARYKKMALDRELSEDYFLDEDGDLSRMTLENAASETMDFVKGGIDSYKLRTDIEKKMRDKKVREGFEKYADETFKNLVIKKKLYVGTDSQGNQKFKDYTLDNVVRSMIKDLRGGENFNYGAGNIRSGIAKKLSSIDAVKKQRGKIVSNKEFEKIKEESDDKYWKLLETIKPKYKFDKYSNRYSDDASDVIFQYAMGRGKLSEAFEEGIREDVDAFLEYLGDLPTEYFEGKAQRAMQLSEFKAAVVPSNVKPETIQALKDAGLEIITYDGNIGEAERIEDRKKSVIEAGKKTQTLFQAQKNNLGLYSMVEKVILEMKLSSWDADKPAVGKEIYAKLSKTTGVKKEELQQLDIETYLQTKDKFTRGEVAQFVRDNGVVIKEIIADKESGSGEAGLYFDERYQQIDDDDSNWSEQVEKWMDEYDVADTLEEVSFLHVKFDIEDYIDNNLESVIPILIAQAEIEGKVDFIEGLKFIEESPSYSNKYVAERAQKEIIPKYFEYKDVFEIDDFKSLFKIRAREIAYDKARDEYLEDPIISVSGENDYEIVGNQTVGFDIMHEGSLVAEGVSSFSEAVIQAEADARSKGILSDSEAEIARFEKFISHEREYKNYRERKLTLPEVEGTFVKEGHFSERNVLLFNRVTDRKLNPKMSWEVLAEKAAAEESPREVNYKIAVEDADNPEYLVKKSATIRDASDGTLIWSVGLRTEADDSFAIESVQKELYNNGLTANFKKGYTYSDGKITYKTPAKKQKEKLHRFIDEGSQSDWHQLGRQKGYRKGLSEESLAALNKEAFDLGEELKLAVNPYRKKYNEKGSHYVIDERDFLEVAMRTAVGMKAEKIHEYVSIHTDEVAQLQTFLAEEDFQQYQEDFRKLFKLKSDLQAENEGVADAPFKNDAWMALGLKRELIDAIEGGYDHFSWADSQMIADRWSREYIELYENQYDKKMPSIIQRLTGINPERFVFENDAPYGAIDASASAGMQAGYWTIPITDELKAKIIGEGFPIFQEGVEKKEPRGSLSLLLGGSRILKLTYSSDWSTIPHEFAHLFLEIQKQIDKEFGRNEVRGEMLRFLGVNNFDDIGVEQHEKFAETFEVYMQAGKSPSEDLDEVFDKFRGWITQVYKVHETDPRFRAELNDTSKYFFDRLLATDAEISRVKETPAFTPLFKSKEQAGMTDEDFKEYLERPDKVKARAQRRVDKQLIDEIRKQRSKEWGEEKSVIIDDEIERLKNTRGYLVAEILKTNPIQTNLLREHLGLEKPIRGEERFIPAKTDSLLTLAAKLGGLNIKEWSVLGIDEAILKDRKTNNRIVGKPTFRKDSGMTPADLVRAAKENGFGDMITIENVLDMVTAEIGGESILSEEGQQLIFLREQQAAREGTDEQKKSLYEKFVKKYGRENGADPEVIAEFYEYATVQQMVEEVSMLEPIKKQAEKNAHAVMTAQYGDILNDGTIEEEVKAAMENEEHASLLLVEIKAMFRKAKKPDTINKAEIKAEAVRVISSMKHSEIRPERFYRAAMKAAREAGSAKTESEKLSAKIKQIANHYLYKEALSTKRNIERQVKYVRKMQTKTWSAKEVGGDFRTIISLVANSYDATKSGQTMQNVQSTLNWFDTQIASGVANVATVLDHNLLAVLAAREDSRARGVRFDAENYKFPRLEDLTAEQMQGLYDQLRHLRFMGGREAEANGSKVSAVCDELVLSIEENGGADYKDDKGVPGEHTKHKREASEAAYKNLNVISLLKKLDNKWKVNEQGLAQKLIWTELEKGFDKETSLGGEMYELLKSELKDVYKLALSRKKKIYDLENGNQLKLGSEHVFMLALYWGTESSRQAVMDGYGMSEKDAMGIMERLTKEQLNTVNQIWKINEHLWPELRDTVIRHEGVAPAKLDPTSFVVNGVAMTGGHMRLFYDSRDIDVKNEQQAGASASKIMPSKAGSAHARIGSGGRPVLLELDNITRAMDDNIHYIAFADVGARIRSIVNNKKVQAIIEKKHGVGFRSALVETINRLTGNREASGENKYISRALRYMRSAATARIMMYSVRNTVQNLTSGITASQEVGVTNLAKAQLEFLDKKKRDELIAFINGASVKMNERSKLVNREAAENIRQMKIHKSKFADMWQTFYDYGFAPQTIVDSLFSYPVWICRFRQSMDEHGDYDRAVSEADQSVKRAVGSGADIYLGAFFQSSQTQTMKGFTMFGSWFNGYLNKMYQDTNGFSTVKSKEAIYTLVTTPFLMGSVAALLVMDFPDDEDDEGWAQWAITNYVKFMGGTVIFLRDAVSLAASGFAPESPIAGTLKGVERGVTAAKSLLDPESERTAFKDISDVLLSLSAMIKIPASGTVARVLDYENSAQQGNEEDGTPTMLKPYQALVEGRNKN